MNILQVIDSLNSGGAERMCVSISNILQEDGHNITLCVTRSGGPLEKSVIPDIRLIILGKRNSIDLVVFRRFLNIVKENNIEIIHAHSSSIFWAIVAKCFFAKVKVIWHDHLGSRIENRNRYNIYKLLSIKINGIIAVTPVLADWSLKNMRVPAERIVMINNFTLLKSIERYPDPNLFKIICLANIRPQKDHETLIRAIALLKKRDLPKKLKVVFAGAVDDSGYSRRIKSMISELSLEDTIEMDGAVENIASLLARADCGVLSSLSEGLPVALLEYGMAALPVIVTDVGHCASVLGFGKYGLIVSAGNSTAMADRLFDIISNMEGYRKMGEDLRFHIINEYGSEHFLKRYYTILRRIVYDEVLIQ